ncbi:hypothetical protein [Nonomuraea dietziae]|uniref:hypothetical protein n=1 Tax=Nonomuraea dietziae TaxID=65515 RepID=UPI0031D002DE
MDGRVRPLGVAAGLRLGTRGAQRACGRRDGRGRWRPANYVPPSTPAPHGANAADALDRDGFTLGGAHRPSRSPMGP